MYVRAAPVAASTAHGTEEREPSTSGNAQIGVSEFDEPRRIRRKRRALAFTQTQTVTFVLPCSNNVLRFHRDLPPFFSFFLELLSRMGRD
jgi:hypothetical protein